MDTPWCSRHTDFFEHTPPPSWQGRQRSICNRHLLLIREQKPLHCRQYRYLLHPVRPRHRRLLSSCMVKLPCLRKVDRVEPGKQRRRELAYRSASLGLSPGFKAFVDPHPATMPYFKGTATSPSCFWGRHTVRTNLPSFTPALSCHSQFLSECNSREHKFSLSPWAAQTFLSWINCGYLLLEGIYKKKWIIKKKLRKIYSYTSAKQPRQQHVLQAKIATFIDISHTRNLVNKTKFEKCLRCTQHKELSTNKLHQKVHLSEYH